jgi:hypothetical protein
MMLLMELMIPLGCLVWKVHLVICSGTLFSKMLCIFAMQVEQQKVNKMYATRTHKESEASTLTSRAAATEEVCTRLRQMGLMRDADAAAATLAALKTRAEEAHRGAMMAEAEGDMASTAMQGALASQGRAADEAQLVQTAVDMLQAGMEAEQSTSMPDRELVEQEKVAKEATEAAELAAAEFCKVEEEIAAEAKQLEVRARGPEQRAKLGALERELAAKRKRVCSVPCQSVCPVLWL